LTRRRSRLRFALGLGLGPLLAAGTLLALSLSPVTLAVRWKEDGLAVSAPKLHFLSGKQLDRLHDGVSVAFDAQLSLLAPSQRTQLERAVDRFVISYDLWEEKFAVTSLRAPRRSASHLSAAAAEAWCIESMRLSPAGLSSSQPFLMSLELRAEESKEINPLLGEPGISIAGLIEIFSRPARTQQDKWQLESLPFRLQDLRR
jgi:hypothetical protein